jgi:DNA-directed RNA polymerase specialized sigma24 family protein
MSRRTASCQRSQVFCFASVESGRTSLREELDASLDRLPAALCSAVILCHLEGHNQEETARIAGCDRSTVSRRAADGR